MATAFEHNAILIITSDHGNVEVMFDPKTGAIETKHDTSPVPIYLMLNNSNFRSQNLKRKFQNQKRQMPACFPMSLRPFWN